VKRVRPGSLRAGAATVAPRPSGVTGPRPRDSPAQALHRARMTSTSGGTEAAPQELHERALLLRISRGDKAAMKPLYERRAPGLLQFIRARTDNATEAASDARQVRIGIDKLPRAQARAVRSLLDRALQDLGAGSEALPDTPRRAVRATSSRCATQRAPAARRLDPPHQRLARRQATASRPSSAKTATAPSVRRGSAPGPDRSGSTPRPRTPGRPPPAAPGSAGPTSAPGHRP
jgi:hypothetical protein